MKINDLRKFFLSGLLTLVTIASAFAADLTARVNTDTVIEGDSFQLILSTQGAAAASPNLTPLNADFEVLGTSQNTSINMVNGNITRSAQWVITLSPKKSGQLTIPPIEAGQASSQALTINVIDAASAPKNLGAAQGIQVTARVNGNGDTFYPFQEIPLTVRIETDKPFQQAGLIAPQLNDVELTQNGQDRQSQLTQNGRVITIIESDYLLRPQTAGQIELPPFVLKGSIPDGRHRDPFSEFDDLFGRSPFGGMRSPGKAFAVRSNPLILDVKPKPTNNNSEWFLPAKAVQLSAEWQPKKPTFKQGEAVTRVVRLEALGARPEQLPQLTFAKVAGAKIYVDNDQTAMRNSPNGTQALREVTLSIVPTHGGEITLPAVSVKWLNTETDETVTSVLPAETIQVQGDAPPPVKTPAPQVKQQTAVEDTPVANTENRSNPWLVWLAGLVVLALASVAWWLTRRRLLANTKPNNNARTNPHQQIKKQLNAAIAEGNAQRFYQIILDWQREDDTINQSAELQAVKNQLEQSLYRAEQSTQTIDLATLGQRAMKVLNQQKAAKTTKYDALPPLYR